MQVPGGIEYTRLIGSHAKVLTEVLSPCGYYVLQPENPGPLQAFVEPALESTVAPDRSLNFLHKSSKPRPILAFDRILDGYGDRPIFVLRRYREIMQRIEGGCVNARFGGEVD